jgi:hypothetical protein
MTLRDTIVDPTPVVRSKLITPLPSDDLKRQILQTRVVQTHESGDKQNLRNPSIANSGQRTKVQERELSFTAGPSNNVAGEFGVITYKP